ncbi:MAG: flagellar hook-length control protein FliK [Burkholderiales bacterium]|nr:flagellar hook-length control protein FliK [Burkholderiales bacterium]
MLPSGDGISVRPVTQVEGPSTVAAIGDTRGDLYQRALQRILGQQLQGEVMSRFTDGSFMVKVGETAARMMLPSGSKIGDKMPMTLVSADPRPTFVIGNDAEQAAIVALSRGAPDEVEARFSHPTTQENDTSHAKLDEHAQKSTGAMQEQLSNAMQSGNAMLSPGNRLAQKFAQIGAMYRPEYEMPTPSTGENAAIITKDGALLTPLDQHHAHHGASQQGNTSFSTTGKLINQLLQAAQRDGATGALQGKEAIVDQPNNPPQQVADALQDTISKSGLFYESHVAEWVDGQRTLSDLMHEPQMQDGQKIAHADPNRVEFAQIVNLQLNTLEQQSTRWQGEIWPGQQMDWEVRKEDQRQGGGEQMQAWQSIVRFQLPTLGEVEASVHLIGNRVHIQVGTGDEDSAALLRQHADALADALGAAGSPLDSLTVMKK